MEWVSTHWVEVVACATAVVTAADRIAALTPTEKDDKVLAKVKGFFTLLALKKRS